MTKHYTHRYGGNPNPWKNVLAAVALLVFFVQATGAFAQERSLTGKITSATDNTPLPGVNVLIKGTARGTVTDANGVFSLSVTDADVLVISAIGFESQELAVGAQSTLNIALKESTAVLNEVVVTALGISQEKKSLSYAVSEVRGDDIAQTQRPNFMSSLQGRVAGLSLTSTSGLPGSSTSIVLRGFSSISGSNQPLIVVDGLPVDNRVFDQHNLVSNGDNRNNDYINRAADVNPNDIASVTVLKGPEAAALYGQEGASGAIIITTKKGTKGAAKIIYDNNFGFQQLYRFPKTQTKYGLGNFGWNDPGADELTYFGPLNAKGTTQYDNVGNFFQTGKSQNHNFVFEGGNENLSNRISLNYYNSKGVIPNNSYEKLSARLTSSTKLLEKIDVNMTLNYIYSSSIKPERGPNGYLLSVLSWPSTDDMTQYLNTDGSRKRVITSDPVSPSFLIEPNNPFFSIYKNNSSDNTNRFLSNLSLKYEPFSWLNFSTVLGADVYFTNGNFFRHPESVGGISIKGSVESYTDVNRRLNGQFLSTIKKDFNGINTTLILGGAFDDRNYEVNAMYGERLLIKEFNSINNTEQTTRNYRSSVTAQRSVSAFGNLNISYKDIIYLNATGRNDWSSTMPIQNRSYFYPSVGLSFVFTELEALSALGPLTFGKIRGTYSEVGKDAPPYRIRQSLINRLYTGGGFSYDFYGGNPALKPERTKGYEMGLETKFYNGRIGADVTVFKRDALDQISTQRLSYGTGFIFGLLNGGQISVQGVEVQVNASPVVSNDFEWNLIFNFSKSKSKTIYLPANVKEYYNSDTWLYGGARGSAYPANLQDFFNPTDYPYYNWSYLQRGMGSASAIGGVTYQRNSQGDILINPANGLPVKTADYLPIGERFPDFNIGLTNSVTYKRVSLSFLFDIRKGGDVFNANEMYLANRGLSTRLLDRETPYVFKGVLKDGNENSETPTQNTIEVLPLTMGSSFYSAFAESDFVEKDINWLRLRDITISYSLPAPLLSKQKVVKNASVFVTLNDLFMLTNYTGADPMVNGTNPATSGAGAFGFDYGSLSVPRTYMFGVRLSL